MNYYIDLTLLPDPEFKATILLNSLYSKLHKALFDLRSNHIGVSFPKYGLTLGNVLRIHGENKALLELQALNWIGGMSGYCDSSTINPVPSGAKFRTVSRIQPNMSQSKLKRLIQRGSITEEEVKQYKAKMFRKGMSDPYVELVSGSNGQKHRRYIVLGELLDSPVHGEFDQFGLSKTATIPWWDSRD